MEHNPLTPLTPLNPHHPTPITQTSPEFPVQLYRVQKLPLAGEPSPYCTVYLHRSAPIAALAPPGTHGGGEGDDTSPPPHPSEYLAVIASVPSPLQNDALYKAKPQHKASNGVTMITNMYRYMELLVLFTKSNI